MKTHLFLSAQTIVGLTLTVLPSLAQSIYEPYTFTTLAGLARQTGRADGTGSAAQFGWRDEGPTGVAVDSVGNVYVADSGNSTIRKVTPAGAVTTLAGLAQFDTNNSPVGIGSTDGTGSAARFWSPLGVAVDGAGTVYVADTDNSTIRKITPAGVVTTLAGFAQQGPFPGLQGGSADGTGSLARFLVPHAVAVDINGNVYVADTGNNTIRKVTPAGVVTTLAGLAGWGGSMDGTGSAARFSSPTGVAADSVGNVYVADAGNYTIRKVTPLGEVTTLAGLAGSYGSADGRGGDARFGFPCIYSTCVSAGVAVDSLGNVFVADSGNNTIRKVTPEGLVTTLAGLSQQAEQDNLGFPIGGSTDGTGSAARFGWDWIDGAYGPTGLAVDSSGNVYVADSGNNTIRKGYPALTITSSGSSHGLSRGNFGFILTGGLAGKSVVVEGSTDLVSWLPLWTNTLTGPLDFSDPQSTAHSNRFYRAHSE